MRLLACALTACLLTACVKPRPPALSTEPPASATGATVATRLAAADALVRAGCLDCLVEAFQEYTAIRGESEVAVAAAQGRSRASALIAIRQAELGISDETYWPLAPDSWTLELVRALTLGPVPAVGMPDAAALQRLLVSAPEPLKVARAAAADDELSAYVWLALACGPLGAATVTPSERLTPVGDLGDAPLIVYKEASCGRPNRQSLEALLNGDPRFTEIHYFLGNLALAGVTRAGQPAGDVDLDAAERHFRLAYEWRRAWPGVTLQIAHVALAAEDFPRALEYYDRTLSLVPAQPDALLGRVRALSYLGRHEEAIVATEPVLTWLRTESEGRYWRAMNLTQLDRQDEAWADIELAGRRLTNVDVPKLAGIIAIRRRDLDVARARLMLARERQTAGRVFPPDCDVGFYLQTVLSERGEWRLAASEAIEAAECFDAEADRLTREIERLQASDLAPERKARQIARREQQQHNGVRRKANARFNAAVASFNLQRKEEALRLAETLVDDEQFGERARAIVLRLQP